MLPSTYALAIYRGDSAHLRVLLWDANQQPIDLTGVTAKSQIRDRPAGAQVTDLVCAVTLPNIIDVTLLAADSQNLPPKGAWDLQLTYLSGDVLTPLAGPVTVTPDVTDSAPACTAASAKRAR